MNASKRPPADTRRRAVSYPGGPSARPGRGAAGSGAARRARPAWLTPAALMLLLPALAVLVLYARTLAHAFVWDDLDLIVRHRALHGADWWRLLGQDFWQSTGGGTGMWRPLVTLSYRVDGSWTGWQPWGFHLVNVLVHMASAVWLTRLALRRGLPAWAAAGAGLVFATAPAMCEPVAWIAGRTDGFVVLATLGALLAAGRWRARGSHRDLAWVMACVLLALLAKESALVLPVLLAADAADANASDANAMPALAAASAAPAGGAAEPGNARGRAGSPVRAGLPALPALLALLVVLAWGVVHRALVAGPAHAPDPGAAAGMAALVWAHLAWLWPWAAHSPLLDLWRPPATSVAVAAWLALAGVALATAWAWRARRPVLLVVALVLAPLLPVAAASLLESGVRFAERALALPVAGLALGLALLASSAPARARTSAQAALALWVLVQCVVTAPLVAVWRDDEARIRRVIAVRPTDPDALLGLADLLSNLGREAEAAQWIARAQSLAPGPSSAVQVARASAEFRAGRLASALSIAEQALESEPGSLAAGMIRVRALARLGRTAAAVAAGEALVASHPGEPVAQGALGVARFAAGDAAGALPLLRGASDHLLDDSGLAWDLGRAAIATGDIVQARAAFERAVVSSPEFYEAWLGVADTRSRLGDASGALEALAHAERLPGAADGRAAALRARLAAR